MRCEEVRTILEDVPSGELPSPVREHLGVCRRCAAYARDWRLVSAGLLELSREPVPEASWGFTARVVRRIEEAMAIRQRRPESAERVGRRFVYATLMLTLVFLLGLLLPSSGPLRSPAADDYYLVRPEVVSARAGIALGEEFSDLQQAMPVAFTGGSERGDR
jgi:hypothetical protein